jgi:hypothetical protein
MAKGPLILLITLFFSSPSMAENDQGLCFDLNRANTKLLKPAPATYPEIGMETESFGSDPKTGYDWAMASGRVKKPVSEILKRLLDPMLTRDADITQVSVTSSPVPGTLQKNHVQIRVKPVFFLTLEWEEDWLYTLKKGSREKPIEVLISYQKTNGTSHIQHFCGNILIQKITPEWSGVYLTEEIKADRRSAEDVYRGLMGTLRTIRE